MKTDDINDFIEWLELDKNFRYNLRFNYNSNGWWIEVRMFSNGFTTEFYTSRPELKQCICELICSITEFRDGKQNG